MKQILIRFKIKIIQAKITYISNSQPNNEIKDLVKYFKKKQKSKKNIRIMIERVDKTGNFDNKIW